MARAKTSPLSIKAKRLALPVAKNPVFEVLGDGVSVGYRRCDGAGTWVARRSDGKGGKSVKRLGIADDYQDADGVGVLSWAQAQAAAFDYDPTKATAEATTKGAMPASISVEKALDLYEADLKTRGGDLGNVQRLRGHVGRNLLDKAVLALTVTDLRKWRDTLAAKLSAATVNRTGNAFKAALNLAADHDSTILTRNSWEKGLASLRDAESARNVILTDAEVKKVVEAAYRQGDEFGLLVEVSAVTGARYSQVAGLTVADLQDDRADPRLIMPSSKKGSGTKKVLRRPLPIPTALAQKLRTAAGNRPGAAPLLLKPQRPLTEAEKRAKKPAPLPEPWRKSDHYRLFKRTVAEAFLADEAPAARADDAGDNDPITIYALRHSSIVRQILARVPVRVVAVMHDTSVAMIEKNYSKHLADHSDAIARAALIDFG